MKRPWQVWLLFAVCVIAAGAGMFWLTQEAIRADERRRMAESEAELEQRISLALWRMDTELAPILAAEVIRPPAEYRPNNRGAIAPPQYVRLQFEATQNGAWRSPQVAAKGSQAAAAELTQLRGEVDLPRLFAELPITPLPNVDDVGKNSFAANPPGGPANAPQQNEFEFLEANSANALPQQQQQLQQANAPAFKGKLTKEADLEQRGKRYQSAAQQSLVNAGARGVQLNGDFSDVANKPPAASTQPPAAVVSVEQVGVSKPVWVGDRLLLARRVSSRHSTVVQGSCLDWPSLKGRLLGEASDLLPNADLMPVNGNGESDPSRMLAGLPVRLIVGEIPQPGEAGATLRLALGIGWGAVLLAVAAAAFLLQGVITLSERRAAFVSSVTHELRTPLTTFRMYAEMLARGMVPDADRRQEYFNTLQREAERLTLLVENVLAYARLERGRRPQAQDRTSLASLLERVGPRLKQRAEQAGMQCVIELQDDKTPSPSPLPRGEVLNEEFTTDQAVVEQILFNLVDNAAKYASDADDRRIHIEAGRNGNSVRLIVRDHGPGINGRPWSRRMQPFGKSAQESADSAPGVGLGLALCRRLARQLGGRLEIGKSTDGGTVASLELTVN